MAKTVFIGIKNNDTIRFSSARIIGTDAGVVIQGNYKHHDRAELLLSSSIQQIMPNGRVIRGQADASVMLYDVFIDRHGASESYIYDGEWQYRNNGKVSRLVDHLAENILDVSRYGSTVMVMG